SKLHLFSKYKTSSSCSSLVTIALVPLSYRGARIKALISYSLGERINNGNEVDGAEHGTVERKGLAIGPPARCLQCPQMWSVIKPGREDQRPNCVNLAVQKMVGKCMIRFLIIRKTLVLKATLFSFCCTSRKNLVHVRSRCRSFVK